MGYASNRVKLRSYWVFSGRGMSWAGVPGCVMDAVPTIRGLCRAPGGSRSNMGPMGGFGAAGDDGQLPVEAMATMGVAGGFDPSDPAKG